MAMMDGMKDNMSDMRDEFDRLKQMEEDGTIDDRGRQKLEELRGKIFDGNS